MEVKALESKPIDRLLESKLKVINMGIQQFSDQLREEGQQVIQMAWRPPAGGNQEMLDIIDRLRDEK